jgi:DNA mismatch endonuclease (patch repair protein)
MDVFSKEKRSDVMSKIHGSGNKDTEIAMIQIFKEFHIIGWRRKQKIMGKPDFTFWKQRVVVFVDGCFWHGCVLHSTKPKTNKEFWENKLSKNKERDNFVTQYLQKKGWKVIRVWEHDLKNPSAVAKDIINALEN